MALLLALTGAPTLSQAQLMNEAEVALEHALALGPQTYRAYSDTAVRKSLE